jgi:DNA-3-methyladenine glycosylase
MNFPRPLPRHFYLRPTLRVARDLLGKLLIRRIDGATLVGRIVEVEAYLGEKDPASHAYRGMTARNSAMFLNGGHLYVYFTYGMHFCCNVVSEAAGTGRAILLRAVEPLEGAGTMAARRLHGDHHGGPPRSGTPRSGKPRSGEPCRGEPCNGKWYEEEPGVREPVRRGLVQLTNGPAKLCQAFGIGRAENGIDLCSNILWIAEDPEHMPFKVRRTTRVGIREGREKLWRFFVDQNPFVSRGRPSGDRAG